MAMAVSFMVWIHWGLAEDTCKTSLLYKWQHTGCVIIRPQRGGLLSFTYSIQCGWSVIVTGRERTRHPFKTSFYMTDKADKASFLKRTFLGSPCSWCCGGLCWIFCADFSWTSPSRQSSPEAQQEHCCTRGRKLSLCCFVTILILISVVFTAYHTSTPRFPQIGRASCRERV